MKCAVRKIREDDLEMIMNWRMSPEVTTYMNTDPKLTLGGQKKWFSSLQENKDVEYWLIEVDGIPAGVINLADIDWNNRITSWAYYIGERKCRSIEIAISLEMSLYDYVFDTLKLAEIHSEIFSINKGVIRLHELCGCHVVDVVPGEVEKNGVKYDITHLALTRDEWLEFRRDKNYDRIDFQVR